MVTLTASPNSKHDVTRSEPSSAVAYRMDDFVTTHDLRVPAILTFRLCCTRSRLRSGASRSLVFASAPQDDDKQHLLTPVLAQLRRRPRTDTAAVAVAVSALSLLLSLEELEKRLDIRCRG